MSKIINLNPCHVTMTVQQFVENVETTMSNVQKTPFSERMQQQEFVQKFPNMCFQLASGNRLVCGSIAVNYDPFDNISIDSLAMSLTIETETKHVNIDDFFHSIDEANLAALQSLNQGLRMKLTYAFMLLLDEIVYWTMKHHPTTKLPRMKLSSYWSKIQQPNTTHFIQGSPLLHDFSTTPMLHTVKSAEIRDSQLRFLRGLSYYITFGFFPEGMSVEDFALFTSNFFNCKHTHVFESEVDAQHCVDVYKQHYSISVAEPGYQDNELSRRHKIKSFPPKFVTSRGLIVKYKDMDDYFNKVIRVGLYPTTIE